MTDLTVPPVPSLARLSGSEFDYEYKRLESMCPTQALVSYVQRTRALFAPIAKAFDDRRNTE